jgi:hypothetical protein
MGARAGPRAVYCIDRAARTSIGLTEQGPRRHLPPVRPGHLGEVSSLLGHVAGRSRQVGDSARFRGHNGARQPGKYRGRYRELAWPLNAHVPAFTTWNGRAGPPGPKVPECTWGQGGSCSAEDFPWFRGRARFARCDGAPRVQVRRRLARATVGAPCSRLDRGRVGAWTRARGWIASHHATLSSTSTTTRRGPNCRALREGVPAFLRWRTCP